MTDLSAPMGIGRRFGGRWVGPVAWSIGAQVLSSATNLGLTVLLTMTAGADGLGRILAVVSVYLLTLTLSRSLFTEPLVAAAGDRSSSAVWATTRRQLLGLAVVAMPAIAAVGTGLGMAGGPDRWALLLVILTLPALLLQDGQRYLAWATGRPRVPALLDACWLAVSVAVVGLVAASTVELDPAPVVAAWSAGGVVSWLLGRRVLRRAGSATTKTTTTVDVTAGPTPVTAATATGATAANTGVTATAGRYRVLARSQAIMTIAVNIGPVVLALAISPTATAVMKLTLVPFAVMLSLFAGLRVLTLPALRRAIDRDGGSRTLGLLVWSAAAAAAVAGVTSIRLVRLIGSGALHDSFELVDRHLGVGALLGVLYVVGQQLADAVTLAGRPAVIGRRLLAVGSEWFGLLTGAAVGGTDGMILGWAIGLAVATAIWAAAWFDRRPDTGTGLWDH